MRVRKLRRGECLALLGCASMVVSGCASDTGEEIDVSRAALSMAATVAEAERAGHDHDAVAHIDADGNVYGQRVDVNPAPRAARPARSTRGAVPADAKPSAKLRDVLSSLATKSGGTLDVIVGAATNTRMKRLPKLERGLARTSPTNAAILAARNQEINDIAIARRADRAPLEGRLRAAGGRIKQEYTFGNAVHAELSADAIAQLMQDPDVLSVTLADEETPPPFVQRARTALGADIYNAFGYDAQMPGLYLGLLDTGVRSSHQQFTATGGGVIEFERDCVYGNDNCLNGGSAFFNTLDPFWGHGTASANIIMGGLSSWGTLYEGISNVTLDNFNTAYHAVGGGSSADAVLKAIGLAVQFSDDIIIAVVQIQTNSTAPIAVAADDAFDAGVMVLGANGNTGQVTNVGSPANARKALGIGAYNAYTDTIIDQFSARVDGRIKPDVQMPSGLDSASSHTFGSGTGGTPSDSTKYVGYGGTSCATASSGGAAGITYEVHNALALGTEPGKLYAALLAGGDGTTPNATNGAGRFRLNDSCGSWFTGVRTVSGSTNQNVTITVPASRQNMHVALWWPEEIGQAHNRVDLRVISPGGTTTSSADATAVWQKVGFAGNTTAGNWTVRMDPSGTLATPQVVYYAVQIACQPVDYFVDPFTDLSNWTETGEGDWNVEALHSSSGYPAGSSGAPAAHSDSCGTECVLISDPIDLSFAGFTTLELSRFVDSELDDGEYLRVDLWDGTSWMQVYNWTNNAGDTNTWHREKMNITEYGLMPDFKIRLRTKSSLITEHVQVDDIRVRSGRP